jgi:DNA modification methylase
LGSEATPEAYLAAMVEVFREVRRVLRDDGTCWVNIGDSYAHTGAAGGSVFDGGRTDGRVAYEADKARGRESRRSTLSGAKPKDLLLMPARLALALQADGWWVRSDIIWSKPNPMPESCTDRPTSAHEHVFLLSKRKTYFYDADAVREDAEYGASVDRDGASCGPFRPTSGGGFRGGTRAHSYGGSRNLRNVWTIPTHAYSDAHFATFPPALVERCIRAGTSERGCCAACGAPWGRVTERAVAFTSGSGRAGKVPNGKHAGSEQALSGDYDIRMGPSVATTTTGWRVSCQCEADVAPCTVLDCFVGSGTTALVADRLQRHAIGIDLSIDYAAMAQRRLEDDCPLFTAWAPAETDAQDERMRDLFSVAAD